MDTNTQYTWDDWLSTRSPAQLSLLLQLRPDVVVPPPTSQAVLSTRLTQQRSYRRALTQLSRPELHVLAELAASQQVPKDNKHLPRLLDYALVFQSTTGDVGLAPGLAEVLHQLPLDLLSATSLRDAASLRALIDDLPEPQAQVLDTLKDAGRRGKTTALQEHKDDHPISKLVSRDLLRVDTRTTDAQHDTVILPEDVYDALHQSVAGAQDNPLELPLPESPARSSHDLLSDRISTNAGAEAAALILHQVQLLLEAIDAHPLQELADGGIGQRELSRLGNATGLSQDTLIFSLEILAALGIIEEGLLSAGEWTSTSSADRFLTASAPDQWELILEAWWNSPRPWSGTPQERALSLSPNAEDTQQLFIRHRLVELLALWDSEITSATPRDVASLAKWKYPLNTFLRGGAAFQDFWYSADALGVTSKGVLTPVGRALLQVGDDSALSSAIAETYPKPVDTLYIQDDYTALAPGPLNAENAEFMRRIALVESPGLATVYRFTQESIRHGLDTGLTASQILGFLTELSATPLPQSLTYFVEDCARKHGALRVGPALAVVHAEDPALITSVMVLPLAEDCGLRLLAPTVAIAQVPSRELLTALQNAGLSPSMENTRGDVVSLLKHRPRPTLTNGYTIVPGSGHSSGVSSVTHALSEERALEMASRICAHEETNRVAGTRYSGDELIAYLEKAIKLHREVIVGFVKGDGVEAQARVLPTGMSAGRLDAFDQHTQRAYRFALHKLRFVRSIDSED